MRNKQNIFTIIILLIVFAFAVSISPVRSLAQVNVSWPGVDWIRPGAPIPSKKLKDALVYLYNNMGGTNIPTCTGQNTFLQYDGTNWICYVKDIPRSIIEPLVGTDANRNMLGISVFTDNPTATKVCKLYGASIGMGTNVVKATVTNKGSFYSPRDNGIMYFQGGQWNLKWAPGTTCLEYGQVWFPERGGGYYARGCVKYDSYNSFINLLDCSYRK